MKRVSSGSIKEFRYPPSGLSLPSPWDGIPEIGISEMSGERAGVHPAEILLDGKADSLDALQTARIFEEGRVQGFEEGRSSTREEMLLRLKEAETKRVEQGVQLARNIAQDRDAFILGSEPELVKLALSIAARVLRREAEIDPLFLTGAVRVALGQLSETVAVRLLVPASELELWSETLPHLPGLKTVPVLVPDERMRPGEVVVETDAGSADLGVGSQLSEIARIFAELSPSRRRADLDDEETAAGVRP